MTLPPIFKAPPFMFMPAEPFGLFTLRPSGSICARAHFAPNLQLPLMPLSVLIELSSCSSCPTHLCEIFAWSCLDCGVGGMKKGTRLSSLTGTLSEELAGNVLSIYTAQKWSVEHVKSDKTKGALILLLAVVGGLLARSNCCELPIIPFDRDWPFWKGVGICAIPTAVSPFAPNELRPLYSPDSRCDDRAAPESRADGFRCIANRC